MKEKVFEFLKTKLTGVQESYLQGVASQLSKTITTEEQIETTITAGVINVIKHSAQVLQTEGDKRATEAQKSAIENYKRKHNLDDNIGGVDSGNGQPKWFKDYLKKQEKATMELIGLLVGNQPIQVMKTIATLVTILKEKK